MSMKESLGKWKESTKRDIDISLIKKTCAAIGVTGEELDACILLGTEFESGELDEAHFLTWLGELCHKTPEEVKQLLAANKPSGQQFPIKSIGVIEYQYRTWLGDEMDTKIWELTTRKDWLEPIVGLPFYIIVPGAQTKVNRYVPINPNDPAWPAILAELEKQRIR